jgi:hypothetical protein
MDPDNKRAWLFQQGDLQLLAGAPIRLHLFRKEFTIDFPFSQMFAELDDDNS